VFNFDGVNQALAQRGYHELVFRTMKRQNAVPNASDDHKLLVIYGVDFNGFSTRSALKC